MDGAGVARGALVPASFAITGHDPHVVDAANVYAMRAAEMHEGRFCVMGKVSIPEPGPWADLSTWLSRSHMRGIRLTFTRQAATWLTDGTADWFWPEAERHDIPVMVFAPGLGAQLGRIAAAHPNLTLIVDHGNLPTQGAAADLDDHVAATCDLARFPRVAVKASALPITLPEEYPFTTSAEVTRRFVDAFGAERVFWGSDFTRARYSYEQGVGYLPESGRFSDDELVWIMGEGLKSALRWPAEPDVSSD